MYCRAHQALPSKPKIIQTGQELMEEWIYLHGLVGIREIGHGFTLYLHNKSPYCQTDNTVRSSVSNRSIHPLDDVLTVEEGVSGWRLKNRQIGHVVHCTSTTRPRTSKLTTELKSARQI